MGASDLEKLLIKIKLELRAEGQIVDMGRDYALAFICLDLTATSGGYSTDELYHAKRDQNDLPGKHGDEPLETAADVACQLLKDIYDWEAMPRHGVERVDVTVIRTAPRVTRNVWGSASGGEVEPPDDPLIVF